MTSERRDDGVSRWRVGDGIALIGVVLACVAARSLLPVDSPSMDERWHLALSTGRGSPFDSRAYPLDTFLRDVGPLTSLRDAPPAWRVWTTLDGVVHPPLYLLALRGWRELFGESDAAARALSVACSAVAGAFLFAATRAAANRTCAIYAGLIWAAAEVPIYLGLEIRGYAMLSALMAVVLWLLVRIDTRQTASRLIMLYAVLLAAMLTHYHAVPLAAGVTGWLIASRPPRGLTIIVALVTAAVYAAIWGPFAWRQINPESAAVDYLRTPGPVLLVTLREVAAWPARVLIETVSPLSIAIGTTIWAGTIALAVRRRPARPFVVITVSLALFLAGVDLIRGMRQLGFIRYAAGAAPAMVALIPLVALAVGRRAAVVHVVGVATVLVLASRWRAPLHDGVQSFAPLAVEMERRMSPHDTLLLAIDLHGELPLFLAHGAMLEMCSTRRCDVVLLTAPVASRLLHDLRSTRGWLVSVSPLGDPGRLAPGASFGEPIDLPPIDLYGVPSVRPRAWPVRFDRSPRSP
jgi:hypothetical protein